MAKNVGFDQAWQLPRRGMRDAFVNKKNRAPQGARYLGESETVSPAIDAPLPVSVEIREGRQNGPDLIACKRVINRLSVAPRRDKPIPPQPCQVLAKRRLA